MCLLLFLLYSIQYFCLNLGQVLWLACVVVPLLSVSLVAGPTDPEVMQKPTGKNQCSITTEVNIIL